MKVDRFGRRQRAATLLAKVFVESGKGGDSIGCRQKYGSLRCVGDQGCEGLYVVLANHIAEVFPVYTKGTAHPRAGTAGQQADYLGC